jgi:hypothetical protein
MRSIQLKRVLLVAAVIVLAIGPQNTSARREEQGDSISAVVASGATLLGSTTSTSSAERFRVRPAELSLSADGTVFVGGPGWKVEDRRVLSFGRIVWKSFGGPRAR